MTTCIILNYNDSSTTIKLANSIRSYHSIDKILIVDGCSTDNSVEELKQIEYDNVIVLQADRNGGYGYGNNMGLEYSKKTGAKYAIIANPDVMFTEEAIINTIMMMKKHEDCMIAAPAMHGREPAYRFSSTPTKDVLQASILMNKLFRPRYYPKGYFDGKTECRVDVIPGSLLIIDIDKLPDEKLYDENIFLYHEEVVIGKKISDMGYSTWINLKDEYYHSHSVSVRKNIKSAITLKKTVIQSHRYYLSKYLNSHAAANMLAVLTPLLCVESFCWNIIKNAKNRFGG